MAMIVFDNEWYQKGVETYEVVIDLYPYSETAWHYYGNSLAGLGQFDKALWAQEMVIAINPNSFLGHFGIASTFQEMEESQVRNYLEILSPILEGYFYSENFSKHWMNSELNVALSEIYSDYFDLFPEPAQYGDKIIGANSEENSDKLWSLFTFACIKKERTFSGNEKLVTSNGVFFK